MQIEQQEAAAPSEREQFEVHAKERGYRLDRSVGGTHTMTPDELKDDLAARGWRITKNSVSREINEANWYAWLPDRPAEWANCECNDKPPAMTIYPHFCSIGGHRLESCEFRLCGQAAGHWFDLKLYSVPAHEAIATIPKALAALGAAWNAIHARSAS